MTAKKTIYHIALYSGLFACVVVLLPWFVSAPACALLVLLHRSAVDWKKRKQYQTLVDHLEASQIDGVPALTVQTQGDVDRMIFEGLTEIAAELEKKCYQLVEKNIQVLSLKEISLSIISTLSEARIVESVTSFLSKGLGFKEVFIGIQDPIKDNFNLYTTREAFGNITSDQKSIRLGAIDGLLGKTIISRSAVLIRNPKMHPIGSIDGEPFLPDSTMESYIMVPMIKSVFSQECGRSSACILKRSPSKDATTLDEAVCPACHRVPVLGIIGVTDGFKAADLNKIDLAAVETLALQVRTYLENSQLYLELQNEEVFRDNVINSMMNGLITVDTEGRILLMNDMAERLSGYRSAEVAGTNVGRIIVDNMKMDDGGPIAATLKKQRKVFMKELWLMKKDGAKLPITLNTSFLFDEDKHIRGVLAVFNDITAIKRMEEKITQLDKLAALGRFSSSMAHEIRNPLAGIVAGLQYLKRAGGIPAEQDENLSFILREVNRIDRLISEILGVVRVGELAYQPTQIDHIVRGCVTSVLEIAEKKAVQIRTEFPEGTRTVMADADRITQATINLLKNAIEASHEDSEVWVSVSYPSDVGDVLFDDIRNFVMIEIKDHGVGFSEEEKGKIFEPFHTTKQSGTGLGLYVTHSIVERHGGYIFVESEHGKGSVFTIYLPIEKVEHGKAREISHPVGR
jgi:PAS domain S-box-containing protein